MGQRHYYADLHCHQHWLIEPIFDRYTASDPTPIGAQYWFRDDVVNTAGGNGVFRYRDLSGNTITLGGFVVTNAFASVYDGTTTATASGADTLRVRTAGSGLTAVVGSNDATFGDNVLFTLNSATSGVNKVLLLDANGGAAINSYVDIGGDLTGSPPQGRLSMSGGALQFYNTAAAARIQIADSFNAITISARWSFQGTNSAPYFRNLPLATIDGCLGYDTTNHVFVYANGSVNDNLVSENRAATLANKTLTTPTIVSYVNATHDHQSAAGGSTLVKAAMPSFDTYVRANTLDQMAAPTADVSFNSRKITNLADPTAAQDAATKTYVDLLINGVKNRTARVATTANIALSAAQTIDGIAAVAGDIVLVKNQTTQSQNGVYTVQSGAWTRVPWMDTAGEVDGVNVIIEDGAQAGTMWLTTSEVATLGTDAIVFTQFNAASDIVAGNGINKTGLTISVVTANSARITVGGSGIDLATVITAGTGIITTYDVYGRITAATDLIGAGGIPARTGVNTYAARTITGTAGNITVTNGDGVSGNPTINLPNVGTAGTYDRVTTDAQGRVTSGVAQKYTTLIGNGTLTSFTVNHALGTTDVVVACYSASTPFSEVYPEVQHTDANNVTLIFTPAPASNSIKIVVRA